MANTIYDVDMGIYKFNIDCFPKKYYVFSYNENVHKLYIFNPKTRKYTPIEGYVAHIERAKMVAVQLYHTHIRKGA